MRSHTNVLVLARIEQAAAAPQTQPLPSHAEGRDYRLWPCYSAPIALPGTGRAEMSLKRARIHHDSPRRDGVAAPCTGAGAVIARGRIPRRPGVRTLVGLVPRRS